MDKEALERANDAAMEQGQRDFETEPEEEEEEDDEEQEDFFREEDDDYDADDPRVNFPERY